MTPRQRAIALIKFAFALALWFATLFAVVNWLACRCPAAELLDFGATWCKPCRQMQPVIASLKAKGYTVHEIDFDQRKDLVAKFNVSSLPCFIITENGRELTRHVGATTEDHLVQLLTRQPRAPAGRTYFRMRGQFPPAFLKQAEAHANRCRHDLAIQWLGYELPEWDAPADVELVQGGAGGATWIAYNKGHAEQFEGKWQGSEDRLLADVIPHEVLHTVMATHFGKPLPRWADEGSACYAETTPSRRIYETTLQQCLTTGRGFPTTKLCSFAEYPDDVMAFYGQSHSLAAFLIEHNGAQGFVAFQESLFSGQPFEAALSSHYEIASLDQLQADWLEWVKAGSPRPATEVAYRLGGRGCFRWRPLKRLWERRPGFIIPRRGQPRGGQTPAAGAASPGTLAAPRLDQPAPPIAAAPGAQPGPADTSPAEESQPPLVSIPQAEPAAGVSDDAAPPANEPQPSYPTKDSPPNEPAGASPSATAPADDSEAAGGLIGRIRAQAEEARHKLREQFEDRIAKLRNRHADELQARDQASDELRGQLATERDESTGLRGKLAHAHATLKNLEREIKEKGPDAAAGAIASRGIKALLISFGLGNIPAALIATAAGFVIRRRFKKLRAKLHANETAAEIEAKIRGFAAPNDSPPVDRPAPEVTSPAAAAVDQPAAPAPPPIIPAAPPREIRVSFEGMMEAHPEDASKDYVRSLVSAGRNLFHEAFLCSLFREAVDLAEREDPQIKPLGGANVASAIKRWVRSEFLTRAGVRI